MYNIGNKMDKSKEARWALSELVCGHNYNAVTIPSAFNFLYPMWVF